jgi:hypothetical protein
MRKLPWLSTHPEYVSFSILIAEFVVKSFDDGDDDADDDVDGSNGGDNSLRNLFTGFAVVKSNNNDDDAM